VSLPECCTMFKFYSPSAPRNIVMFDLGFLHVLKIVGAKWRGRGAGVVCFRSEGG
jgi:hypothetical protein